MTNYRVPHYPKDVDYQTNAGSYYDDLARKNELLKHLAYRIWEYDKELHKRFMQWDQNLATINQDVINMMNEWMADGTLSQIINEELFGDLKDLIQTMENQVQENTNALQVFDNVKLDMEGFYEEFTIDTLRDEESQTSYHLAKIPSLDKDGQRIKIKHRHTGDSYPSSANKSIREFSVEHEASLAINASTYSETTGRLVGVYIKDGEVIQDTQNAQVYNYILAYNEVGNFRSYPPNTTAATILADGYTNAVTSFIPLIENGIGTSSAVLGLRDIFLEPHPRSAIAKDVQGNTYFFTSEGRVINEFGMFAEDVQRVLLSHGMVWAHMLDGGGSSQMVAYHSNINRVSGDMGSKERDVGNSLYISKDNVNKTANQLLGLMGQANMNVARQNNTYQYLRYQRNNHIDMSQYLINGWQNHGSSGSGIVRAWIMPNNTMYLIGTITGGELNMPFMKLPDDIKPMFSTHHIAFGDEENELYKVIVTSSGELQWYYWNTAGRPPNTEGPNYVKFDGIFIPLNTPDQGIQ